MKKRKNEQSTLTSNFYTLSEKCSPIARLFSLISLPLIPAAGALGMMTLFCDAFGIFDSLKPPLILLCFGAALLFAVMSLSKKLFLGGLVLMTVGGAAFALLSGNPLTRLTAAMKAMIDCMVTRLETAGYNAFSPFDFDGVISSNPARDRELALALLILLVTALFSACSMKRVRLLPPFVLCFAVMSYVFLYNLTSASLPFATVLCFLAALTAKRLCARLPDEGGTKQTTASASGFAAMLLTAAVAIPASLMIDAPTPVLPIIDQPMQYARAVVSSLIMGDLPSVLELGFSGYMGTFSDRTAEASDRTFTGKEIMTVESGLARSIYMRSWVGVDYRENAWKAASVAQLERYRDRFEEYEGFTPERLTVNFFKLLDPNMTKMSSIFSARDFSEHGYMTTYVDVTPTDISGNLLVVPTMRDPLSGPYEVGSRNETGYEETVTPYFDGITTTDWTNFDRDIRYVAYLPTMHSSDYEQNFQQDLQTVETLRSTMSLATENEDISDAQFNRILTTGITRLDMFDDLTYNYLSDEFIHLDKEERLAAVKEYVTLSELYDEWVVESYLSTGDEDISYLFPHMEKINARLFVGEVGESQKIVDIFGFTSNPSDQTEIGLHYTTSLGGIRYVANRSRHSLTRAVIDYLGELCNYTLTPKSTSHEEMSALQIFLDDTREGYCVQFATAAVMLLRSYGVPCRYAEGYLASDFTRNTTENGNNYYRTTVRDYDAHAWLEVYYDGYGWRTYEATPPYTESFYAVEETESTGNVLPEREAEETLFPEEDPIEMTEDEEEEALSTALPSIKSFLVLSGILLGMIVLALPFLLVRRTLRRRRRLLDEIRHALLVGERLKRASFDCIGLTMRTLKALGLVRGQTELPMDFAARCDERLAALDFAFDSSMVDVMALFEKECFGSGMTCEELRLCGRFNEALWETASVHAGFFKKIICGLSKGRCKF